MKLAIDFDTHLDALIILPTLVIRELTCDNCPEVHGYSFEFSFGFWTLSIMVLK